MTEARPSGMTGPRPAYAASFVPLADYVAPDVPPEELFRTLLGRVRALLVRHDPKPFIAAGQLEKASAEALDAVAPPPACGPLLGELERCIAAWLEETPRVTTIKPIVLPPCDDSVIVRSWARQHGHQTIEAPARAMLVSAPLPTLDGEGVLVIPRLEIGSCGTATACAWSACCSPRSMRVRGRWWSGAIAAHGRSCPSRSRSISCCPTR